MKNSSRARQLVNTELKTRSRNKRVKKILAHHTPTEVHDDLVVDFYCECSDDNCKTRVSLKFEEYDALHDSPAKFVLAKGHQSPMVEKVTLQEEDLMVVEKYSL